MDRGDGAQERLPSGRHSLTADFVVQHQVSRILSGVIELVGTDGYARLTVDAIIGWAGVSRATFYKHFSNKEDAFLQAFDSMAERLMEHVIAAYQGEVGGDGRLRAGLAAYLEFLANEPMAARTCIVESLAAGPAAAERRDQAVRAFEQIIDRDMRVLYPQFPEPGLFAEAVVGGIFAVTYSRIRRGETDQLPGLLNGLLAAFAIPDPARWGPDAPPPPAH